LLATTGLGVDAVAARVGYGDLSTFRRLFRRETGLSPREYQRRFSRRHAGRGAASGPAPAAR
jgi:transcriptional regulator GlxA family with amidase domain